MNFNFMELACRTLKEVLVPPVTETRVVEPKIDVTVNIYINNYIYTSGLGQRTKSMVGKSYMDQYC